MVVARVILMSAMLTAGIVEVTRMTVPHLAEEALKAAPVDAPVVDAPLVVPVSAAPVSAAPVDPACTQAAWPYRPDFCLRPEGGSSGAAPRRPVRMIEERRPAAPVRMPGRVSVG
ncbi:hypothetical protein [Methylobacterium aquaticum]|uniref:Uncharacterized protein n=1 Tax=Methylobacterium aquaticum TaxID=270351 RepID=A0A0J6T3N9_9HYPH|nr:hypothetical protein [Methylobacterium aquaticum]KMO40218.1 hypothetical protein VP06_02990 [Methylobacterium aquaticum]